MICPQLTYSAPPSSQMSPLPLLLWHMLSGLDLLCPCLCFFTCCSLAFSTLSPHQCLFILRKSVRMSSPLGRLSWLYFPPSSSHRFCRSWPLQTSKSICQLSCPSLDHEVLASHNWVFLCFYSNALPTFTVSSKWQAHRHVSSNPSPENNPNLCKACTRMFKAALFWLVPK